MRVLQDGKGTEWTVFEVRRRGAPSDSWSYLPSGYGNGWLCFESAGGKRRLTTYPDDWNGLDDAELLRLLATAEPVRKDFRRMLKPDGDASDDSDSRPR